jgi:hypothetical protein
LEAADLISIDWLSEMTLCLSGEAVQMANAIRGCCGKSLTSLDLSCQDVDAEGAKVVAEALKVRVDVVQFRWGLNHFRTLVPPGLGSTVKVHFSL